MVNVVLYFEPSELSEEHLSYLAPSSECFVIENFQNVEDDVNNFRLEVNIIFNVLDIGEQ